MQGDFADSSEEDSVDGAKKQAKKPGDPSKAKSAQKQSTRTKRPKKVFYFKPESVMTAHPDVQR